MTKAKGVTPGQSGQHEGNNGFRKGVRMGNWSEELQADIAVPPQVPPKELFKTASMRSYHPHPIEVPKHARGLPSVGKDLLFSHSKPGTTDRVDFRSTVKGDFGNPRPPAAEDFGGDVFARIRAVAKSRGAAGIKGLSRSFRIMDDDRSFTISRDEFKKGLRDYGLRDLSEDELDSIANEFDKNNDDSIDIDEFLLRMRPPMNQFRLDLIERAWVKADPNGDGSITVQDVKGRYCVKGHPQYLSGEKTEKQLLIKFLKKFEAPEDADGTVTKREFFDYYAGVSSGLDDDNHFALMIRNAWKI